MLSFDKSADYADSWSSGCNPNVTTCTAGLAVFSSGVPQRHLETQDYLFCDGHVKAYKGQTLTQSAAVYNYATPASTSGNSPTFNVAP